MYYPHPTFLGIKLDLKLDFKMHLENIRRKIESKQNLIKRLKGLKLPNTYKLCADIYRCLIRSVIDYAFIPVLTSTSRISTEIKKIQNKILKTIKFFPIKTPTKSIHNFFLNGHGKREMESTFLKLYEP